MAQNLLFPKAKAHCTVKYIQGVKDGLYTWTTDKEQAKRFITGKSYEIGENDFTEAENGTGELTVKNLEVGSYILEEVKAPNNAELIENQTKHHLQLKQTIKHLLKNSQNDTSKVDKTTPNLDGKDVAIGEKLNIKFL